MPRRAAAVALVVASLFAVILAQAPAREAAPDVTFFVIGDPQINLEKWGTAGTEATIDLMNRFPGTPLPSGLPTPEPRGVLILGDLVDDLKNPDNWKAYQALFGERGDGRLRFPTYEAAGNHDLDGALTDGRFSYVQQALVERNKRRPGALNFSADGYHYSWDWEDLHLVCLNVFPGTVPRRVYDRDAPWNHPNGSLEFLREDLRVRVGTSRRPIIVFWHYGLRGWGLEKWWLPEDLRALKEVLAPYNIALLLHGHEHRYERYTWEGHDVVMAPSPQYDRDPEKPGSVSTPKGFLVVRLARERMEIAYRTPASWGASWTKRVRRPTAVDLAR